MVGSAPSAPTPPDPVATAQAQGQMNAETARTQAALNRVNQYGPDGSITYSQTGPDQWSMNTQLSPDNQYLYDATKQGQRTYSDAANNQLQQVSGILSQPFDGQPYRAAGDQALGSAQGATSMAQNAAGQPFNAQPWLASTGNATMAAGQATRMAQGATAQPWRDPSGGASQGALSYGSQNAAAASRYAGMPVNTDYNQVRQQSIDAANSRLEPQFREQEDALRTRLLNSGIPEGSEGWNRAYRQMNEAQNDSRQQTILNAENLAGQSIQQTAALRGIPLNELATAQGIYQGYGSQADQTLAHGITSRGVPLNEASQLSGIAGQQGALAGQGLAQALQARQQPFTEAQMISSLSGNQGNLANQQLQQALALRTQPLNEAQALLTGSAVQSPMLQNVPQSSVAPTDYLGAVNANYAGQMGAYNSQMQKQSSALGAALGGGAGLLGSLGGAAIKYLPWGKIF